MRGKVWLLVVILAGCAQPAPVEEQSPAAPDPLAPELEIHWSPEQPVAGHPVSFGFKGKKEQGDDILETLWTIEDQTRVNGTVRHVFERPGTYPVLLEVRMTSGAVGRAEAHVEVAADEGGGPPGDPGDPGEPQDPQDPGDPEDPGTEGPEAPPVLDTTFTCGGASVVEASATHGRSSEPFGDLVWASLKTGFRLVVAWESDAEVLGEVQLSVDGQTFEAADTVPTRLHLFVIDGLPENMPLCFHAKSGTETSAVHGVWTKNAVNAWDPATSSYVINTLAVANEAPDVGRLEQGTRTYGHLLHDATDGHVRAGRNILIVQDPLHHNSGWASCAVGWIFTFHGPTCHLIYDIHYTNDALAAGAASANPDGITTPRGGIWMNWYWQAAPIHLDDTGSVLMHEMGHYAFGMIDMYTNGPDCWDAGLQISVMGGNRDATEFDDEVHRCPNEASIGGYEPAWTSLRNRYPNVAERTEIDPGPDDAGPENFVDVLRFL